jgi:hypothetical protein
MSNVIINLTRKKTLTFKALTSCNKSKYFQNSESILKCSIDGEDMFDASFLVSFHFSSVLNQLFILDPKITPFLVFDEIGIWLQPSSHNCCSGYGIKSCINLLELWESYLHFWYSKFPEFLFWIVVKSSIFLGHSILSRTKFQQLRHFPKLVTPTLLIVWGHVNTHWKVDIVLYNFDIQLPVRSSHTSIRFTFSDCCL